MRTLRGGCADSGASGRESSRCSGAPPFALSAKTECTERCLF
nr:MAG TPA: hypothetical protein [Siphoviridae sp. ctXG577]